MGTHFVCLFILFAVYRSAFACVLYTITFARHFRRFAARDSRRRKFFLLFSLTRTRVFLHSNSSNSSNAGVSIDTRALVQYICIHTSHHLVRAPLSASSPSLAETPPPAAGAARRAGRERRRPRRQHDAPSRSPPCACRAAARSECRAGPPSVGGHRRCSARSVAAQSAAAG